MPELPEVETVVIGLSRILIGKTIKDVEIFWNGTIATPKPESFTKSLKGQTIQTLSRRAKFIVISLEGDAWWLIHLRMSGQLRWRKIPKPEEFPFVRVRIDFTDGSALFFNDFRNFGKMYFFSDSTALEKEVFSKLGPEPLEIGAETFLKIFCNKRGKIKANLLRQDLLSGIGNIYADESLFAAKIHPESETSRIPAEKLRGLNMAIQNILKRAILLRGTTTANYADVNGSAGSFKKFLQVYRKQGQKCQNCSGKIKRIKVAGRGTHICESCQEKY